MKKVKTKKEIKEEKMRISLRCLENRIAKDHMNCGPDKSFLESCRRQKKAAEHGQKNEEGSKA